MKNAFKIAVLLTCFNRKEKTIKALMSVQKAAEIYNSSHDSRLTLHVFLTNDGCNDGTPEAARALFLPEEINIIDSDGNSYWAGGMRLAWKQAMDSHLKWDFYLLINDDVEFVPSAFETLFYTHEYAITKYGKGGVYSGFICSKSEPNRIIYGAKSYKKNLLSKAYDLSPTGAPQQCLMVNANILMVCPNVVDGIGQLDTVFIHGGADWDYGIRASRAGFPVLATPEICGVGENDHDNDFQERKKVVKMSLSERRSFLNKPNKGYQDALYFFKRYNKFKFFITKLAYQINLYLPSLFYNLNRVR